MTPAVRAILFANVGAFLVTFSAAADGRPLFEPNEAVTQPGSGGSLHLFIHDPLASAHPSTSCALMFGVDLGTLGTRSCATTSSMALVRAATVACPSALPPRAESPATIGASGAIWSLLAWALLFPHRRILFMFIFPLPARVAALLMGAMSFLSAVSGTNGSVAEATHLSGLLIGWLYLQGPKNLRLDLQYRLTKWRMDRMRKRFDVYKGGRGNGGWDGRVH
jgi:hypothetical protein